MGRVALQILSMICLIALLFTELDMTQRLLLTGVIVPAAVATLWDGK